ncbi:WAT1-related protein At3g18200 isoform X2 [Nicotiana tabacum]|uniref:WAT1-related protein At3g18200 isoform X2 n=1 Tax=Nicotiana tabacum TaxID=4097 RepID=A0A1S3XI74_TOBAC|nr:PREDICTED: WAT1-related protein At3g18200-like isoform X2 [Nicotiana tabacum]
MAERSNSTSIDKESVSTRNNKREGHFDNSDSVTKKLRNDTLEEPKAEISVQNDSKNGSELYFEIEADVAEDKGSRHTMEDASVVLPDASLEFPGKLRCAHFAIYDGHGGRLAAEYAQKHLHANVLSAGLPRELLDVKAAKKAIHEGFRRTDESLLQESAKGGWQDGAAAVCAWVLGSKVFVANIGDAKAILARSSPADGSNNSSDGSTPIKAIVLTREHKAIYPQERARIQKAGGSVSSNGRLQARLEVSRAFGDRQFKKVFGPSDAVDFVQKLLKLCYAGFHIVSRLALNIGVSKIVYPVYRNIIALLLLGPFAYFLEKKERPPLTFSLLVQFFLLALIGITANQGFYILGLYYASPTFASAMQNSVPAITFIMASILSLERVHFMRRDGMAKILGTIASVGGATIITLYKGPPLLRGSNSSAEDMAASHEKMLNWTWGCVYLLGHCLSWAGWMVLQAPIVKQYPAKLSLTSFTCFFGLIQFSVIAAFTERDPTRWKIHSGEEVYLILYAGIVSSGIVLSLQTWCIQKGGPVYVATFQPVQTVLVAVMAFVVLGDQLYSGGILGGLLIVVGLYLVLWGKNEEKRIVNKHTEEATLTKHLLASSSEESSVGADVC